MKLQEQIQRIQEMMGNNNPNFQNEASDKSLVMQNKYNEEIEKTQLYNYLLNRYEIQEIDGRYKLFDKIDNRSYFTNNNQLNKTIDSLIWNVGSKIDKMDEKELIKIFKSFCKKINLNWDCDRDKETMINIMIRQVVHYFFLKIRKEI
jgi:hypothetical protein